MKTSRKQLGLALALILLTLPLAVFALPAGFEFEIIARGFEFPVSARFAPDGRIFVAEKGGKVKIVKDGVVLPTPFITLTDVNTYNDKGLLDIELDPDFALNGYLYLLYTYENNPADFEGPKTARLVRVTAGGDEAIPGSEVVILGTVGGNGANPSCENFPVTSDCIPSDSGSHTIGSLHFAPDGTIFLSTGEGASFTEVDAKALRAQNLDSLGGKILHITKEGKGLPDNPFYTGSPDDNRSKVWAYGMRNPFRFALQPGINIPFVGDVGWFEWEEVNVAKKGANLGWPCWEGLNHQSGYESFAVCQDLYASAGDTKPLYTYPHPPGAAVVGGDFYTGSIYPAEYHNAFFFADYARSQIAYLHVDGAGNLVPGSVKDFTLEAGAPVQIFRGPNTDLYYMNIFPGQLVRIKYLPGNRPPTISISASPASGPAPLHVNFSSEGTFDPDGDAFEILWSFGDGATSTEANPVHDYVSDGVYEVRFSARDSFGNESAKMLEIRVGNPPTAEIISPAPGSKYNIGDTVVFEGRGTDADDGTLPASNLSWQVSGFHCDPHDPEEGGVHEEGCHIHPAGSFTGPSGSFSVTDLGDIAFYEIKLTVRDSSGLEDSEMLRIDLNTSAISFGTQPPDLGIIYDGKLRTGPFTVAIPVGATRTIEAPTPQGSMNFVRWSDGGARMHNIVISAESQTYTALFSPADGYLAEYFNNINLEGDYALTRIDPAINFEWGLEGSPDPRVNIDQFSARWTKHQMFSAGTYHFTVTADDGFRLYLDDILILDEWHDQPPTTYSVEREISAGEHTIRMEYYENGYNAVAKLSYGEIGGCTSRAAEVHISSYESGDAKWYFDEIPVTPGITYIYSDYYKSDVPTSLVAQIRKLDGTFEYLWMGDPEPASGWTRAEGFFAAPAGASRAVVFHLIRTPGSLTIDEVNMHEDGASENLVANPSFEAPGPAGWSQNSWGANAPVFTYPVPGFGGGSSSGFCAEYFNNMTLAGAPTLVRNDPEINFEWGDGSPDMSISPDHFSARWISSREFVAGTYRFTVTADDGVRLYLDEALIIDEWHDQPPTTFSVDQDLADGTHTLRMEYYENEYSAVAKLAIENVSSCTVRAAKVEITSYSSGDAKWYFDEVPMTPGVTYLYSNRFMADAPTSLVAQIRLVDGTFDYIWLEDFPSAPDWSLASTSITAPAGASKLTIFHLIRSLGSLTIDEVSLTRSGEMSNLVANPSFEISGPAGWSRNSWGINSPVFSYPVQGFGTCDIPPPTPSSDQLRFDGIDDYVDVGTWNIEEPTFTIEASFVTDDSRNTRLLAKASSTATTDYVWFLGLARIDDSESTLIFMLNTDGSTTLLSGGAVTPGENVHAAAVYDGSEMRLYKNGIVVARLAKSGTIVRNLAPVWIGGNPPGPTSRPFKGLIDDMRVWNVVRSDSEIADNMASDLVGEQIGLIKYWKFDEGFGQDIIDNSNSGHHGRLGSTADVDANDPTWESGGSNAPTTDFVPTHLGTTSTRAGTEFLITTNVQNTGSEPGHLIVNMEIYNSEGLQVLQDFYDGVTLRAGETKSFEFRFTPPSPGTYRSAVGLIELNWRAVYSWINEALILES